MFSSKDKLFMERAFELAEESFDDEEVPVGAVIVKDGKIIGEGKNKVISKNDVTSHAEINALRDASKNTNNYRLNARDHAIKFYETAKYKILKRYYGSDTGIPHTTMIKEI